VLISSIMFGAIVLAALLVQAIFDVAGLIPETRPDVESITERGIGWNYTTFLNILFFGVAAVLIALTLRSGARDPVCGMTVDRLQTPFRSEWGGKTYYFCSEGCKSRFDANPEEYLGPSQPREAAHQH
jgi:YHS domain-containing protein